MKINKSTLLKLIGAAIAAAGYFVEARLTKDEIAEAVEEEINKRLLKEPTNEE